MKLSAKHAMTRGEAFDKWLKCSASGIRRPGNIANRQSLVASATRKLGAKNDQLKTINFHCPADD